MVEVAAKAFLSYAHDDNDREGGRIHRLSEQIRNEFETLTGTTIEIFVDDAEIHWGQDFRAKLDEALQETTFFIPVLTPTYFLRDECRKEMNRFVTSAVSLGLEKLLMSIRYVLVPDLKEGSPDELKDVAARMQYEPWEGLRLLEETSSEYRKGINRLASRLVELTLDLESRPVVPVRNVREMAVTTSLGLPGVGADVSEPTATPDGNDDEDEPGLLDLVADIEPAMSAWSETLSAMSPASERLNMTFDFATAKMNDANTRPNSFAAKIVIARQLAIDAEEPLSAIEDLSKEYSTGILRLDPSMRALLSMVATETGDEDISEFVTSVQGLIDASDSAMVSIRGAVDIAKTNMKLSRDLRPIFRRYETAMRNVIDGQVLIKSWKPLLDAAATQPPPIEAAK
jgi:hypothetical protein